MSPGAGEAAHSVCSELSNLTQTFLDKTHQFWICCCISRALLWDVGLLEKLSPVQKFPVLFFASVGLSRCKFSQLLPQGWKMMDFFLGEFFSARLLLKGRLYENFGRKENFNARQF